MTDMPTPSERPADTFAARLSGRYLSAILQGDRQAAASAVGDGLEQGLDAPTLLLEVLAPPLRTVGEKWHRGEVSVEDEHWATETTLEEMERVRRARSSRNRLGLDAVVSVVEGEAHVLPARVVGTLLEHRGWRVDFLGGSMPPEDLAAFVRRRRPDLVALSVTLSEALPAARKCAELLRALDPRPLVLVGGAAFRGAAEAGEGADSVEADVVVVDALEGIARSEALLGARQRPMDAADYLSLVGGRIRQVRNELGLSQGEVAERASLTRPYLSAVERGRQNITLEVLLRLAEALAVPLTDLLRDQD
jgi:methanogenic corrinoid protein MtbC1/DNA-binding XRE family transcriptional regulator